jgi:hypothetical protein
MGGSTGKITGKSKIEVYLHYVEKTKEWDGDSMPDPKYKKYCKRQMNWNPDTGEWVLHYHLHT